MSDTPAMLQYKQIKEQYPDCILFFRMGDFYEMFNEDAYITSKVLDIALTSRSKGENKQPMAGIPYHALMNYLPKMTNAGYKVAICEQMEDPKKAKGVVKRDVVRIITPGTVLDSETMDPKKSIQIACIRLPHKKKEHIGLAAIDVSQGEFFVYIIANEKELMNVLQNLMPSEILLEESALYDETTKKDHEALLRILADYPTSYIAEGDFSHGYTYLLNHFQTTSLKGFLPEMTQLEESIMAAGALLAYVETTQKSPARNIHAVQLFDFSNRMFLDAATISSLELVYANTKGQSLADILDQTSTAMGSRYLRQSIRYPLTNSITIQKRLDHVSYIKDTYDLQTLQGYLSEIADIERINARISYMTASPRDFLSLQSSLSALLALITYLHANGDIDLLAEDLVSKIQTIIAIIAKTIHPLATQLLHGSVINEGIDEKLDELKSLLKNGKGWIKTFQEQEMKRTGINSLKVQYNKVFGYYIEVSHVHQSKVPADYIRKQTLVNAERYITQELKDKEDMILNAQDTILTIESSLYASFKETMLQYIDDISQIAKEVAYMDMVTTFGVNATMYGYTKPIISQDKIQKPMIITAGRHPVIERNMDAIDYIPNDVYLDTSTNQILLITGPNMAGKSSILRMSALITLMAQIGSFVPASSCEFSIVDRIFSRVGARDNLANGESTFMVEMHETANILNNATSDSLIILDEIGRGTSTYDGVSIAYAVIEYIHEHIGAKTMFATHYHELIELENLYKRVKNANVQVLEQKGDIIFLRKLVKGGTDKSYGIHVAKLAGIPPHVVSRAHMILQEYEKTKDGIKHSQMPPLLEMMDDTSSPEEQKVIEMLKAIDLNNTTPLQALQHLQSILDALS